MEVVASLCQGRTAAAQCGLFKHKSVPVIFEPPCNTASIHRSDKCDRDCPFCYKKRDENLKKFNV